MLLTAISRATDARGAVAELRASIASRTNAGISLLVAYATEDVATDDFVRALSLAFPDTPIFGGTTSGGVLTETGSHHGEAVTSLLAVIDEQGCYGASTVVIEASAGDAASKAVEQALIDAGRPYEAPAQVWLCAPPGHEEEVLSGIAAVVGPNCPIVGGSSADNTIAGNWRQFGRNGTYQTAVSVAVLFPSGANGLAFESGYAPTGRTMRVRATERRVIHTLDGQPAANRYRRELFGLDADASVSEALVATKLPTPFGRFLGTFEGVDEYLLLHAATFEADGSVGVFADIHDGEELSVMTGDGASVIRRAGMAVADARSLAGFEDDETAGALIIFCAGCMMGMPDRLDEVVDALRQKLGPAPFLTAFTFGEQGASVTAGNQHGNLMIACSVLGHAAD